VKQSKSSRTWLVVAVIAALLFIGILANPQFAFRSIPLEQLITAIEDGHVKQIIVRNETQVVAIYEDGTQVSTTKPAEMDLLSEVEITNLDRAILYSEETNPIGQVIRAGMLIILPLIVLITLYLFYINRVNAVKATATS
jgi:ATP-dependent Zn protease